MKCPNCNDKDLLITERQNVEIDYCPECRGVWLDKGELDKIIERSDYSAPQLAASGGKQYPGFDTNYYKPKKRKSLLNELFDF
jgi:Zn-finger nucleic acid-binding protein